MVSRQPFERIVEIHGPRVRRVCRAVLGRADADADDAWSETFLSALRAYPSLPADANVEAWLVTIAHRRAIDVARSRGRQPVPTAAIADHPASGETAEPGSVVLAALAALPDKQRWTIAYHHLAGLPYADVADIVGGTPAAARRAAADGIGALRRALGAAPAASRSRHEEAHR